MVEAAARRSTVDRRPRAVALHVLPGDSHLHLEAKRPAEVPAGGWAVTEIRKQK